MTDNNYEPKLSEEEAPYDGSVTYYEAKPQTLPEGLTSVPPVGENASEGPVHEAPDEK